MLINLLMLGQALPQYDDTLIPFRLLVQSIKISSTLQPSNPLIRAFSTQQIPSQPSIFPEHPL